MILLILCNKVPWPPKDGGSIATYNLSKGIAGAGHKVSVLAMNTPKHYINPETIPGNINSEINISLVYVNTKINFFSAILNFLFSAYPI